MTVVRPQSVREIFDSPAGCFVCHVVGVIHGLSMMCKQKLVQIAYMSSDV